MARFGRRGRAVTARTPLHRASDGVVASVTELFVETNFDPALADAARALEIMAAWAPRA